MKQRIIALGDLHLSDGSAHDHFKEDDLLNKTLSKFNRGIKTSFVFNGDVFDFLRTPYKDRYDTHVTSEMSVWKIRAIAKAHPKFFKMLANLSKKNIVIFMNGNHDQDLTFLEVQQEIKRLIKGNNRNIKFPGYTHRIGCVHIEHGAQYDTLYHMNPRNLFVKYGRKKILNYPYTARELIEFYRMYEDRLTLSERVRPKRLLYKRYPQLRKMFVYDMATEWLRLRKNKRRSPFRSGSKELVELGKRLFKVSPKISMLPVGKLILRKNRNICAVILGHDHSPLHRSVGKRHILKPGAWKEEYRRRDGRFYIEEKHYVELVLEGKDIKKAEIHEVISARKPATWSAIDKEIKRLLRNPLYRRRNN